MKSNRVVRLAGALAACAALVGVGAGTASAEPLWPGGPDIPGVPAIIPPPPPPLPVMSCHAAGAKMCIDKSDNQAWLLDGNGNVVYGPTPISHGRPGFETPAAATRVTFKREDHWSTLHNAPMKWAVFFNGDIATHIGPIQEQSHGCIRMTPEGAEATYNHLQPSDLVEVVE